MFFILLNYNYSSNRCQKPSNKIILLAKTVVVLKQFHPNLMEQQLIIFLLIIQK